ncbi:MAG: hypothetical protein WC100_02510 [Sterolibacterium sp.]
MAGFSLLHKNYFLWQDLRMNKETAELLSAAHVRQLAIVHAKHNVGETDYDAASVAILIRAVELATPELSQERRAGLFMETEND